MAHFFKGLFSSKTMPPIQLLPETERVLSTQDALQIVCQSLDKYYREEYAATLAKLKMLQLMQEAKSIPAPFQQAWDTIQARSTSQAQAIAELSVEIQMLLSGKQSELW